MENSTQIFVSYAHIDNESLLDTEEGFVTTLHRMLEVRLAQLLGEKPMVWRDPQMMGNAQITGTLNQQLAESDFLISILSPRYLKSEWCQREIETFFNRVGEVNRIFKVVKTEVPAEQHPKPLVDSLSYLFYTRDRDSGRLREFRPGSPETSQYFVDRVDDLAFDLHRTIQQSASNLIAVAGDNTLSANSELPTPVAVNDDKMITVYLAQTVIGLEEIRDQIRRQLQECGCCVLPSVDLPYEKHALEEHVLADIKQSDIAIHVVGGPSYGLIVEGDTVSRVERQELISEAYAENNELRRIIYIPKTEGCSDDRQLEFLNRLQNSTASRFNTELLTSHFDELSEVIQETLEYFEAVKLAKSSSISVDTGPLKNPHPLVYLICTAEDLEAVDPIDQYLYNQDCEVMIPLFEGEGSEEEIAADHARNICNCDAVVVYHGAAGDAWFRKIYHEVRNSSELGRSRPLDNVVICLGAPATLRKQRFRAAKHKVIDYTQTLLPAELESFIEGLKHYER